MRLIHNLDTCNWAFAMTKYPFDLKDALVVYKAVLQSLLLSLPRLKEEK